MQREEENDYENAILMYRKAFHSLYTLTELAETSDPVLNLLRGKCSQAEIRVQQLQLWLEQGGDPSLSLSPPPVAIQRFCKPAQ